MHGTENLKFIKAFRITTQSAMSGRFSKGFCAKEFCSLKLMNLSVCPSLHLNPWLQKLPRSLTLVPISEIACILSSCISTNHLCFFHIPAGKWRNESSARHCLSIWTAARLTGRVNIYLPTDNKHTTCLHVPLYSPFILNFLPCHRPFLPVQKDLTSSRRFASSVSWNILLVGCLRRTSRGQH
jgi:hypothetical protein